MLHTPGDVYFEPSHVAIGYAGRRGQAGRDAAAAHDGHRDPTSSDGAVQGVETDRGRIESPVVVDAAGRLGAPGGG